MFHIEAFSLSRRWPSAGTHLLHVGSGQLAREASRGHNDSAFWLHAFAFAVRASPSSWTIFRSSSVIGTSSSRSSGFGHSPPHLAGQRANSLRRRRRHLRCHRISTAATGLLMHRQPAVHCRASLPLAPDQLIRVVTAVDSPGLPSTSRVDVAIEESTRQ